MHFDHEGLVTDYLIIFSDIMFNINCSSVIVNTSICENYTCVYVFNVSSSSCINSTNLTASVLPLVQEWMNNFHTGQQ